MVDIKWLQIVHRFEGKMNVDEFQGRARSLCQTDGIRNGMFREVGAIQRDEY